MNTTLEQNYLQSTMILCFKSFRETIGENMPGFAAYLASDICGYLLAIIVNIIMIYGSAVDNRSDFIYLTYDRNPSFRWYFVPWLIINMIIVITLFIGCLVIFICHSEILHLYSHQL